MTMQVGDLRVRIGRVLALLTAVASTLGACGSAGDEGSPKSEPRCPAAIEIVGLSKVVKLATSGMHACALIEGGTVSCWGENWNAQVGDGSFENTVDVPVDVEGLDDIVDLEVGAGHSCAVLEDGTVRCWGGSRYGETGVETATGSSRVVVPTEVQGLSDVVAIVAGESHTCALRSGGQVSCWGENSVGQLGDGSSSEFTVAPVDVEGLSGVVALAAGGRHTCAVLEDSTVSCWGENQYGQLGDGTIGTIRNVPVEVQDLSAVAVRGGDSHTCAIDAEGTVLCWGELQSGGASAAPVEVSGVEDVAGLAAGYGHTCAAHSDGSVSCWGLNHFGQLGDGTLQDRDEPVEVCGLEGVAFLSAGDFNTCAVSDGRVLCWGRIDPLVGGPVVSEDPSSETIGLRCGAPVACDAGSHCHSGFYLERSVCTRDCSDQSDCPAGTQCVANIRDLDSERTEGSYCLLPCRSDTDCPDSDCSSEHAEGSYCF